MSYSKNRTKSASSKGRKHKGKNFTKLTAPITLEDLNRKETPVGKDDLTVRMITIRLVPTDDDSATIKRNLRVLDNPDNVLQVLNHRKAIEEALRGNNITTGPNQYNYVRQFITGEALRVFNEGSTTLGNETVGNLTLALNYLVTFNCPKEVLSKHTEYLKTRLYKPSNLNMRQYVGCFNNLNALCEQLPPNFDANQKLSERDCILIIANKAPKSHKKMLCQHGYNPENGSMQELVEYCERAEVNDEVEHGATPNRLIQIDLTSESSEDDNKKTIRSRRKKTFKKLQYQGTSRVLL